MFIATPKFFSVRFCRLRSDDPGGHCESHAGPADIQCFPEVNKLVQTEYLLNFSLQKQGEKKTDRFPRWPHANTTRHELAHVQYITYIWNHPEKSIIPMTSKIRFCGHRLHRVRWKYEHCGRLDSWNPQKGLLLRGTHPTATNLPFVDWRTVKRKQWRKLAESKTRVESLLPVWRHRIYQNPSSSFWTSRRFYKQLPKDFPGSTFQEKEYE